MKKLLIISLLSISFFNLAYADDFKLNCSIENDHTKEVLVQKELHLKLPSEEYTTDFQEILLKVDLGKLGEATLEGSGSIFNMKDSFEISVFATLKIPKKELLIANHDDTTLDRHYGDIAHAGSLISLNKELYRFGCEIRRSKP